MRHFVAVAEELNFRRAAERLGMSQPPLSQSIQALEQDLEVALFERRRQRVYLTAAGRLLLARSRTILADVEATRSDLRAAACGGGGDLRIGFTASAALMPLLHHALHRFRCASPGVLLLAREMPSREQIEALERRGLDIGIARRPPLERSASLEFSLLCRDALVVAVHESHPIAALPAIRMKLLRDEAFISYPHGAGTSLYQESLLALAKSAAFYPAIVQEAHDSSTIIALVASGLGVAIVPASLRCIHMQGVRFVDLLDSSARTALYIVHRSQDASASMNAFRDLLVSASPTISRG